MTGPAYAKVGEVLGCPAAGSVDKAIASVHWGISVDGEPYVGVVVDSTGQSPIVLDFEVARALAKMINRAADKAEAAR